MKNFLNKIKIPSLYVLSFVLSVLPVAVYLIINHERYVSTTPERVKLLFGGILAIAILVIKTLGFLKVKGEGLEIIKLDTYQGNVSIKGRVDSLVYTDNINQKVKEESFIGKLFK
jgi:sporulation protein YabP